VVIHNLNIKGIAVLEAKTEPPLVVDANAELTLAVSSQCLQAIAGWNPKIVNGYGAIQHLQFTFGGGRERFELLRTSALKQIPRGFASKRFNHNV
jgi:hypothetical protein